MNDVASPMPLRIDLVSDVVCPWCVIGYKQLEKALSEREGQVELDLHWHAFELNPAMPEEGQELAEHLREKYGSTPEQGRGFRTRLVELGESLGFSFNYREGQRMHNTFRAHQLLHWAAEHDLQTELKLALFEANFTRNENVNDLDVLLAVVGAVGLPVDEARRVLDDGRYARAVRDEERHWLQEGVQGVPCFVINQQYVVQGAQDSTAFGRMLDKMLAAHAA